MTYFCGIRLFKKIFIIQLLLALGGFSYAMEAPSDIPLVSKCEKHMQQNLGEYRNQLFFGENDTLLNQLITDIESDLKTGAIEQADKLIKLIKYGSVSGDREFLSYLESKHSDSDKTYYPTEFGILRYKVSDQLNNWTNEELLALLKRKKDLYGILANKMLVIEESKRPEIILKRRILKLLRENSPREKDKSLSFFSSLSPFVIEMLFSSKKVEDKEYVKIVLKDILSLDGTCDSLSQLFTTPELIALIKKLAVECGHFDLSKSRSASETHALVCSDLIVRGFKYNVKKEQFPFLDLIYKKERELVQEGYPYILYSGRKGAYDFLCTVATLLKEIQLGKRLQDFQLLRFAPQLRENYLNKSDAEIRELIVNNGVGYDRSSTNRPFLQCLCCALAGNSQEASAESSLMYALLNHSCADDIYSLESLFESMNMEKYFVPEEWEECANYFKDNLNGGGNLLQIAFKKDLLEQCVYIARPGGNKASIRINGKRESNPAVILDALRYDPFLVSSEDTANDIRDSLQARLVLTEDLILNPSNPHVQSGIKILSYSVAGSEKREKWLQMVNRVMEKIKARYLEDQKNK